MYQNYTAFISYRHHPLDSAVAEDIQRRLERFYVPAGLRNQTGRRLGRIFRDKAELAITSDINEDIQQALESSDHLIVICSTHTAESIWVQREIEAFLRTHDRRRVLTVLAEGQPQDVIPQVLCWQEEPQPDGSIRRVPAEPLSCDFRGYTTSRSARRIALREELPRLAAALLDCPYDALRQRQRQYQMHRLLAGGAAALVCMAALTGYFLWSSLRIQENYNEALRSQSLYLASEALQQLEAGDRLAALQLAMVAIPTKDNPRPLMPQAQYALSRAVAAYRVPENDRYEAVHNFEHAGSVEEYLLNTHGNRLYVLESGNNITAWDTGSYGKVFTCHKPEGTLERILLAAQDKVLVLIFQDRVQALDSETGETLWECAETDGRTPDTASLQPGPDDRYLYLHHYDLKNDSRNHLLLWQLDALTGQPVKQLELPLPQGCSNNSRLYQLCFSADSTRLAFEYLSLYCKEPGHSLDSFVALCDINAGTTVTVQHHLDDIYDMGFTPAGQLVLLAQPYANDPALSTLAAKSQRPCVAICVNADDGTDRWAALCTEELEWAGDCGLYFAAPPLEQQAADTVVCAVDSTWLYLDADTGIQLRSQKCSGRVLCTEITDTGLRGLSSGGSLLMDPMDGSQPYSTAITNPYHNFDPDGFAMAGDTVVGNYYSLALFRPRPSDASWQPIMPTQDTLLVREQWYVPGGLLLADYNNRYYMLDEETLTVRWEKELETGVGATAALAPDGSVLYLWEKHSSGEFCATVHSLQLADGSVTTIQLSSEKYTSVFALCGLNEGRFAAALLHGELVVLEADGSVHRRYTLPDTVYKMQPSPDGSMLLLKELSTNQVYLMALKTGACIPLCVFDTVGFNVHWAPDSSMLAVTNAYRVLIYNAKGQLLLTLPLDDTPPISSCFAGEDTLLVACENEYLYTYSLADGSLLGRTPLESLNSLDLIWTHAGDYITLGCLGQLYLIDAHQGTLLAMAENALGFLPTQQRFVARARHALGTFPLHTAGELVQMGALQLGGRPLSRELALEYGLETE